MQESPEEQQRPKKEIGNYSFQKTLGKGAFGKVKLATHKPTGQPVAIKILEKDKIIDVADVERVSREIHILKLIRHPNIIQLYEIIETPKYLFLVMEFVENGELFDYIVKQKRLKEQEACKLYHQLINGIEYTHKLSIVHRDLKPENLLLDYDHSLKIVDFGLSNTYKQGETLKTPCGSPCYAAPEMIKAEKYHGLRADIWSSGVILFAMLCGYLPFQDENTGNLYKKILSGKYSVSKSLSEDAKDILSRILELDPERRATVEDIRDHSWMKNNAQVPNNQGIIIGYNRMPVDGNILAKLSKQGYDPEYVTKCVQANRHNDATAAYYLTLKAHLKEGGNSPCDMSSNTFDMKLIEPLKRQESDEAKPAIIFHDAFQNKENRERNPSRSVNKKLSKQSKNDIKTDIEVDLKDIKNKHFIRANSGKENSCRKSVGKTNAANVTVRGRSRDITTPANKISKKYREQFNKSLISRSYDRGQEKSLLKNERKRIASYVANELVSGVSSISKDRHNFRSELCDLSSTDYPYADLLASYNIGQPSTAKYHKRGKSSQGSIQRKVDVTVSSINESIMNISKQLKVGGGQMSGRRARLLQ